MCIKHVYVYNLDFWLLELETEATKDSCATGCTSAYADLYAYGLLIAIDFMQLSDIKLELSAF